MDLDRIKSLAGVKTEKSEFETNSMLNEATVIPVDSSIEQIAAMLDAARRGLGFVNRLKNPIDRKKHLSSIFNNMNKIRAALSRAIDRTAAEDQAIMANAPENNEWGGWGKFGG